MKPPSPTPSAAPQFLAEALDLASDDPTLQRDASALLEACAPPATDEVSADNLARLTQAVSTGALCFAPFFDQLAELYQLHESAIVELLEDGPWHSTVLPGVSVKSVKLGPGLAGCEGRLTRFRAGTRFPLHTHGGRERVLVILGSFKDSVTGEVFGPGDLQEMRTGTNHGFVVDQTGPCISASVHEQPFRFDSWLTYFRGSQARAMAVRGKSRLCSTASGTGGVHLRCTAWGGG
jgi:anti-sigma factor ChrR (cupin superfamily)